MLKMTPEDGASVIEEMLLISVEREQAGGGHRYTERQQSERKSSCTIVTLWLDRGKPVTTNVWKHLDSKLRSAISDGQTSSSNQEKMDDFARHRMVAGKFEVVVTKLADSIYAWVTEHNKFT